MYGSGASATECIVRPFTNRLCSYTQFAGLILVSAAGTGGSRVNSLLEFPADQNIANVPSQRAAKACGCSAAGMRAIAAQAVAAIEIH
jgi:hypothetical protein